MRTVDEVLLTLLSEVNEICKMNNLHYFLADKNVLSAYRKGAFIENITSIEIAMPLKDAKLFREYVLRDKKDRVVDSLYDNDMFPALFFRYSDVSSTDIDLRQSLGFSSYGVYVDIKILRKKPSKYVQTLLNFFEKGWISNHPNYLYTPSRRYIKTLSKIFIGLFRTTYKKVLLFLFEKSQNNTSLSDKLFFIEVPFLDPPERKYTFKKGLFSEQIFIPLENIHVSVPRNVERYLNDLYGKKWRDINTDTSLSQNIRVIVDANLPYRFYLEELREQSKTFPSRKVFDKEIEAHKKTLDFNKLIDDAWLIVKRTGIRFAMQKRYMPLKNQIIELYESKKWEELEIILSDYDDMVIEYQKKNLGIAFDKEILEIYLSLLKHQGREKFAEKLLKSIPLQHLQS